MQPIPHLESVIADFSRIKEAILHKWVSHGSVESVLKRHGIETEFFIRQYASGVYDYFESVILGLMQIGDCPVMAKLLEYLKDHDVSSDELFMLCSHFRRTMVDASYEIGVNSLAIYDEISYVFDLNFSSVLKRYNETIYQKEREIERNVKLLEEYRRAIDESAIVAKTDSRGIITYANEKLSRICGYRKEELVGSSYTILYHPDMPPQFFRQLRKTVMGNGVFKGTIKSRARDGSVFYVDTTVVPITDTQNAIAEYMAISYEVTDLVVAKEDAIAAGQAKEYFLSNMSHEIRTPLNAILGFVALLKDEARTEKDRRYLDIIYNSGENLLCIINDILDFSKLRSGEFTVERKRFNLHNTITYTLELFVPSVSQNQLTMTSFIDPRIPYELISDPLRIQQVISNLLGNAIKFTPPGGQIKVEASFAEGSIVVSVIDTGIGIAAKEQRLIFDPFSQAKSDELPGRGGTGLGLSISAQLVRHMGGEITVRSQPGFGSTFTFTLPAEIGGETHHGPMDIAWARRLKLALYSAGEATTDAMSGSLERYMRSFGVKLERVASVDAPYDLLFFPEQHISTRQRKELLEEPRPKVALMDAPYDTYEGVPGVTTLVMPLYCAKLQEVMETALKGERTFSPQAGSARVCFNAHLLVAEDNEANRELIGTLLENLGITYEMVDNGADALFRMRTGRYDAVLMDEQMPIMNGRDAVKALRRIEQEEGKPTLPVIALTANVLGGPERRRIYDDFLGKPIRIDALVASLERFVGRGGPAAVPAPRAGGGRPRFRELCEILQISDEQLRTLIGVYREKMTQSLEALAEAVRAEDLKRVSLLAHSVKGSSSNFRFETLTRLAETVETGARAGDMNLDYDRLLEEMRLAFGAVLELENDSN